MSAQDPVAVKIADVLADIGGRLADLVGTNPVSGLPNKLAFSRALAAAQQGPPLGVIAIEVNGFKNTNSACGHDGGDAVLCEIAQRLKETAENAGTASAYHLSGDEFAILVEGQEPGEVEAIAQRAKGAVEAASIAVPGRPDLAPGEVTISVAVGHVPADAAVEAIRETWQQVDTLTEYQKWAEQAPAVLTLWGAGSEALEFARRAEAAARHRVRCEECDCFGYLHFPAGFRGCRRGCLLPQGALGEPRSGVRNSSAEVDAGGP